MAANLLGNSEVQGLLLNQVGQQLTGSNKEKTDDENPEIQRETGCCACFKWWLKNPCSGKGCAFCGWVLFGILSPIFFIVYEATEDSLLNYGYFLLCGLSIIMSLYATCLWQDVYDIRKAINDFELESEQTEENAKKLKREVIRLTKTRQRLSEIEEDLSSNNEELTFRKQNFERWLGMLNESTDDAADEIKKLKNKYIKHIQVHKRNIIKNEKETLDKAFNHVQYESDDIKGLNQEEFNKMMQIIPKRFTDKLEKRGKSFADFAGRDNNLDWKEFLAFMGEMIDQDVNTGIDLPEDDIAQIKKRKVEVT